ncbi:MAG: hypothetical protein FRX48_09513 [Lasallia pustulata]|uniref:Uncharacterized protein n=1 Tax=Lasallia pustulata TaxID=136370 RepID=A0A5M8PBW0_9LECA|nr:MAG: hypothetical protein FRX48_09513 [Lasallia pustulata]
MAVRKVIQDSDDDENDLDHSPPSASKVPPRNSGSTVVDLGSPLAAHTSIGKEPSTGSTEVLIREIFIAQNSLLDSTPSGNTSDAIVTQPISTTRLSTMSKLKRRQTTGGTSESSKKRVVKIYGAKASKDDFDFHSSSDEGGDIVRRKRQKHENMSEGPVFGKVMHEKGLQLLDSSASNESLDKGLDPGRKSITITDVNSNAIFTAASRMERSRALSPSETCNAHDVTPTKHGNDHRSWDSVTENTISSNETPLGHSATKKKRSRRRATTHYSSSVAQQDVSVVHSEVMSGASPRLNVFEAAILNMRGSSRTSPDVISLAQDEPHIQSNSMSTSTEMLRPLENYALALQPNSDYSCPSTIPFTASNEPSEAQAAAANEGSYLKSLSWSSSARMTSPTIAGNSTQEIENASENYVSASIEGQINPSESPMNMRLAEEDVIINSASRPSLPGKGRSQPLATDLRTTQELDHEVRDEHSKPSVANEGGVNPQAPKGALKRKAQDDIPTDDLGSDDIEVGFPKEQYQPRPSRSRATHADNEFLLALDFSKRPEAVAKAKIKRRRTTGGHIPTHADVTVDNVAELGDDELKAPGKTRHKRIRATGDQDAPHGDIRPIDFPQHDADGTEKHKESRETLASAGVPEQEAMLGPIDGSKENEVNEANKVDKPSAKAEEPKKKRGRARKKTTDDPLTLPENPPDRPPTAPEAPAEKASNPPPAAKKTSQRQKPADPTASITSISEERVVSDDEAPDLAAANVSHNTPQQPKSPPRPLKPAAPVQTPEKRGAKGPDKHSPLNSGKVPYRVGLSRRARIEPLLRVVGR